MKKALAVLLLLAAALAARAQDPGKPLLLVAAPDLRGPYSQTALLVVPVDGRHVGFILNRATGVRLAALFPEHAPSAKVVDPVYFGGPEMAGAIFAVVPRDPGQPSLRLPGGLFVSAEAQVVDRIIEQTPNDARFFAGFVGWQPGELAKEIEAGFWYLTDPDPALVFRKDQGMWEELIERLGNGSVPRRDKPRGRIDA